MLDPMELLYCYKTSILFQMEMARDYHRSVFEFRFRFDGAKPQSPHNLLLLKAQMAQQQQDHVAHSTANVANQHRHFILCGCTIC
jgi:hypothetical protein